MDVIGAATPGMLGGKAPKTHGTGRTCVGCDRRLSIYNPGKACSSCEASMKKWKSAKYPDGCIDCPLMERFDHAHVAHGRCKRCDNAWRNAERAKARQLEPLPPIVVDEPEDLMAEPVEHAEPDPLTDDLDEPSTNGRPPAEGEVAEAADQLHRLTAHDVPRDADLHEFRSSPWRNCCTSAEDDPIHVVGCVNDPLYDDRAEAPDATEPEAPIEPKRYTMPLWLFVVILFHLLALAFFAGARRSR